MRLARRTMQVSPSKTFGVDALVREMRSRGVDIVNFSLGEPDFDTPDHIKDRAVDAIRAGFTKYTPTAGIPELRAAICEKLRADNGLVYSPQEVLVSCGAKHSIFNAVFALCDEGDEVIIPSPYWVSYPEMVRLAGGVPVVVEGDIGNGFKVSASAIEKAITPRTRAMILNSPCNPTGSVYSRREIAEIAEVAVAHGVVVISDEIYEKLVYGGAEHVSIASLGPEIKQLAIVVNGVSKTYAMTGWRVGYAAGPREVIQAMETIQGHVTSNPTSISQKAALAGIAGPKEPVERMRAEFAKRRDYMVRRLNEIPDVTCPAPDGAFYAFPDVSRYFGRRIDDVMIEDSTAFAEALLRHGHVAVVPGIAFGCDTCVRLSYAASMERIAEGLHRMGEVLSRAR
ncbi:MAG: pyridoxal phosphate-dependent aminotransferase [Betaproteobacteria bacterium]